MRIRETRRIWEIRKIRKEVFIGPLIMIALWFLISKLKIVDPFFFPGPVETIQELVRLGLEGTIIKDTAITMERTAIAFFIAGSIGVPLGLLLGSSRRTYECFEGVIDFFRSIPATAMFPLFMILF